MTREQAIKIEHMVSVMGAYANGKQIQHKIFCKNFWVDDDEPEWDWVRNDYRVKPEESKDEYRPFTYEEACAYVGSVIVRKDGSDKRLIHSVNNRCKPFQINGMTAEYILDNYNFLNGDPCGMNVYESKTCVTCKHNDNGTADPLNGLCVNCENFNNWEKDA